MCKHSKSVEKMFNSERGREIYQRILDTVKSENMAQLIESGVLVGLSGGADSVLLLSFLCEYRRRTDKNFPIFAVHVNHGIRGDEAKRDEQRKNRSLDCH